MAGSVLTSPDSTPESKKLLGLEEHARLIHTPLGESCPAQDCRRFDSQFFQL